MSECSLLTEPRAIRAFCESFLLKNHFYFSPLLFSSSPKHTPVTLINSWSEQYLCAKREHGWVFVCRDFSHLGICQEHQRER